MQKLDVTRGENPPSVGPVGTNVIPSGQRSSGAGTAASTGAGCVASTTTGAGLAWWQPTRAPSSSSPLQAARLAPDRETRERALCMGLLERIGDLVAQLG